MKRYPGEADWTPEHRAWVRRKTLEKKEREQLAAELLVERELERRRLWRENKKAQRKWQKHKAARQLELAVAA